MDSYAGLERETGDLERRAKELRDAHARLREELDSAMERRRELTALDPSRWHTPRFAVIVWLAVVALVVTAIGLVGGGP
jgi:hypothetical protein